MGKKWTLFREDIQMTKGHMNDFHCTTMRYYLTLVGQTFIKDNKYWGEFGEKGPCHSNGP